MLFHSISIYIVIKVITLFSSTDTYSSQMIGGTTVKIINKVVVHFQCSIFVA